MADLSTYRISDFILFSRETLLEVYADYNSNLWPWQMVFLALSAFLLWVVIAPSRHKTATKLVFGLLAFCWIFVGAVFHLKYFISINWVAKYFGYLFVVQGILFAGFTFLKKQITVVSFRHDAVSKLGALLLLISAFVPFELFLNYELNQLVMFGWGAERTIIGTLGLLLCTRGSGFRWLLFPLPLIFLILSCLMFYGFKK